MAKLLLIDDEPDTLRTYTDILEAAGYQVATAATGVEALAKIDGYHPDVILLDIMLPGKDGFEVARELAGRPDAQDIPIIVVTALRPLPEDTNMRRACGIRRIIYKPCRPRTLIECIDEVMRYRW